MAQSVQIKKMSAWHEELIDFMLAQPRAGLKETSDFFGVSMSWLSIVKNSDAFRNEWEKRRKVHSSAVSVTIVERVEALAEVALETMTDKLEREGASVGLTTLREISETALKSLGFGQRNLPGQGNGNTFNNNTTNNMIVVDKDTLARAREARTRMQLGPATPSLELSTSVEQEAGATSEIDKDSPSTSSREVEDSDSSESEGGGGFPLGRELPPPDSLPPRRTSNEADSIFKTLFGNDTNEGD